jgi:hypothetical protein
MIDVSYEVDTTPGFFLSLISAFQGIPNRILNWPSTP